MKVLLYFENEGVFKKSGMGRALQHQKKALSLVGIEYTTDKNDTYDIAHVNTYNSQSIKLVNKCVKNGVPVIVHGHSTKEDFRNSFSFWKLLEGSINSAIEKTYSKPDLIITPTPYSKRLIEGYDFVSCPVVNISNGIDLDKYANAVVTQEDNKALREKFKIGLNEKIVMGIGWMFERKGFHDFISLAKEFPDIKFIWFGQKNKILNTKIINKAIDNKTPNVLLPGYVDQDTIIKMLHMADVFLFPSYEETEGIVILEALATKTPILVRDIGVFDYLTDGVDCYKAKDNDEFKSKITYILNNDCSDVLEKGFKVAEERDLQIIGTLLKEQYERVINMHKKDE